MMPTQLGTTIEQLIQETRSIASLVEYLRDNELFVNCEPVDQYKFGFLYKIGLDEWTKATGIDPELLPTRYSLNELTEDGRLWTDFDFEDDGNGNSYYEHDGTQYVYIALDNYTGQFDNDDCMMAAQIHPLVSTA